MRQPYNTEGEPSDGMVEVNTQGNPATIVKEVLQSYALDKLMGIKGVDAITSDITLELGDRLLGDQLVIKEMQSKIIRHAIGSSGASSTRAFTTAVADAQTTGRFQMVVDTGWLFKVTRGDNQETFLAEYEEEAIESDSFYKPFWMVTAHDLAMKGESLKRDASHKMHNASLFVQGSDCIARELKAAEGIQIRDLVNTEGIIEFSF